MQEQLTDAQCDDFRRYNGNFNDMVRHIFKAGQAQTEPNLLDALEEICTMLPYSSPAEALRIAREAIDQSGRPK